MSQLLPLRPAVFLDRDGTILEERGYLNHMSRFQMFDFAAGAIKGLNAAHLPVIIITNQSGVARGLFPAFLVDEVHKKMSQDLALKGAHVEAIYACLHGPHDGCACRKPKTALLEQAADKYSIDLKRSFVIGDRYSDIEMGHRAGTRAILVLTGYGRGELEWYGLTWRDKPDFLAENISDAASWILKGLR